MHLSVVVAFAGCKCSWGCTEITEVAPAVIQTSPEHGCSFIATLHCYLIALWGCLHPCAPLFSRPWSTASTVGGWRGKMWDGSLGWRPWGNSSMWRASATSLLSRLSSRAARLELAQASGPATSLGFPGLCMGWCARWLFLQGFWRSKSKT